MEKNTVKNQESDLDKDVIQKDLLSERSALTKEARAKFSSPDHQIISMLNNEGSFENTYFFLFNDGSARESFFKSNPFIDPSSEVGGRVAVLNCAIPTGSEILEFSEVLLEELEKLSLKRITLVGFEDGASVVQALCILSPRLFRRAILVDPLSRVRPGVVVRTIDWIEQFLPVGLPFRAMNKDFDSRPFLHRIRCPIMVVISPSENFYNAKESRYISAKIPNCYLVETQEVPYQVSQGSFSSEFLSLIKDFCDSPAKRPQKNR